MGAVTAGWKPWAIGHYRNPDCNTPATSCRARHKGKECTRAGGGRLLLESPCFSQYCPRMDSKSCRKIDTVDLNIVSDLALKQADD